MEDIGYIPKSWSLQYQRTRTHISYLDAILIVTGSKQALLTVMASVGASSAYATDIVAVQRVYYGQSWNFSCKESQIL